MAQKKVFGSLRYGYLGIRYIFGACGVILSSKVGINRKQKLRQNYSYLEYRSFYD